MKACTFFPRMGMPLVICVLAGIAAGQTQSSSTLAQTSTAVPRTITVDDQFAVPDVTDPQITADGKWVAYVVSTESLKDDKTNSRIWMIPTAGGDAIPLTAEDESSAHPRWSPDGKFLAFTSKRGDSKSSQVYLLNRLGGEAQKLTQTVPDVDDFAWSPNGKRLVLLLRDPSLDELDEAADKSKAGPESKEKTKTPHPIVIDRYEYKADEIGYLDRRRGHLFVFDIATKAMTQITSGDFDDSDPAWSPDGNSIAFSSKRTMPDPDRTYDSNIFVVAADNQDKGAHLTQITTNPGSDDHPAWSPDGKWIAYITQTEPKLFEYATHHLGISPATGGIAKVLTLAFDRVITEPHFAPDSQSIYFIADDDGTMDVCRVSINGGNITRPIPGNLIVSSFSVAKTGEIAATLSTADRPYEVFTVADGGSPQRISHVNDSWLAQVKLSTPEYVKFKSKDGTVIRGFLYKPVDYVPGKKYPAILRPHGGPTWAYYYEFTHLAQLFAANGYVVLYPNPRGSTGYGEDFAKVIFADWGNKDFQDDMAMVDYAIAQGLVDPDKLGVGGWSYGGISTDFIIGQTNRFKAAISGAGSSEYVSMYGHDQYTRDYETELGRPWENRAKWDHVAYFWNVANIKTPSLFMGGDIDWNVPILGGEHMYQALKSLNCETELVVYPGEYHGFKTPSHLKDRDERYLAWYAHYVKQDGTPARPPEPPKPPAAEQKSAGSE